MRVDKPTHAPTAIAAVLGVAALAAVPSMTPATAATVTVRTVKVGAPGNASVAVVPFTDAIYQSCSDAPQTSAGCQTVGGVDYNYGIGRARSHRQAVGDVPEHGRSDRPRPARPLRAIESSSAWPKYGQINYRRRRRQRPPLLGRLPGSGPTSPTASPTSCRPPGSSTRSTTAPALQDNRSAGGFNYVTYQVRLSHSRPGAACTTSPATSAPERPAATRRASSCPSQDEWIKAAYFDPSGGGTYSYWKYPTNAGSLRRRHRHRPEHDHARPHDRRCHERRDPAARHLPRVRQRGTRAGARRRCSPMTARASTRSGSTPPPTPRPTRAASAPSARRGPVAVGHPGSGRQRGRVDRHDHAAAGRQPRPRVWRRLHGGVSNAPAYQLWPSAVGLQPQDNKFYDHTYPWLGFRIGVVGNLKVKKH